ncbi:MAG: diguanylate cyclase [Clostridia bacterium]|nr:diguanylate cyclase [Clostridia bacterium]
MLNTSWMIKEINFNKFLPYFNVFFVVIILINDLSGKIYTLIEPWLFFLYCLSLLLIMTISHIAWVRMETKKIWASRILILMALMIISYCSLSSLYCYLYNLQVISITVWYKDWKDFLVGLILLNIVYIFSAWLNPFAVLNMVEGGIPVLTNIVLAYCLYYYSENLKKLGQVSKIFRIMLDNTDNGIQFIDKEGKTQIINPAAGIIYNRPEEELYGKTDWELYYGGKKFDENGNYTSLITESLETGKVHKNAERIFIDENGKQKVFQVETFRVYDDEQDEIIGAIGIYRDITEQKETERGLLDANYEMANMAVTDDLTKLYNVRYFRQMLNTEVAKAYNSCLSLLIIDIDHFKMYNDLYGHLEGDKVLMEIGRILKSSFRTYDIVARYGGEEFTVILPGMDKEKAKEVAERIRLTIRETKIPGEEKLPGGKLTVTIGVATFPDDASSADELIQFADNALYRGKYVQRDVVITSLVS